MEWKERNLRHGQERKRNKRTGNERTASAIEEKARIDNERK